MVGRNRIAILVAEFLGTGLLAMVMLSVQHSTIGLPYFVALAAGLTLAVAMVALGRSGGGHFNPAITIGMWTARQIKTIPAVAYIAAQMLGAWAAYYLYTYFVKTSLPTIGGHYDSHVLVAEAVGAFVLAMGYAAAVFNRFWSVKTAGTVGTSYMLAIIVAAAVVVTGGMGIGIVNPAVALSMRAFDVFGSMGWGTYALGPILGAVIGFNLYALLFAPENSLARMRAVMGEKSGRAVAATTISEAVEIAAEEETDDEEEAEAEAEEKPAAKHHSNKHGKNRKNHKK
ncbi:MAG TPA: aquaporin [Candidatus Saccharimonadales bacterium]|nr:aquaporin [Candidatus Saccharimonadales bacterium]